MPTVQLLWGPTRCFFKEDENLRVLFFQFLNYAIEILERRGHGALVAAALVALEKLKLEAWRLLVGFRCRRGGGCGRLWGWRYSSRSRLDSSRGDATFAAVTIVGRGRSSEIGERDNRRRCGCQYVLRRAHVGHGRGLPWG